MTALQTAVAPAALQAPLGALDFELPAALEAGEPAEARGLRRDEVRLLVTQGCGELAQHAQFRDIGRFLDAGDVLVVNTSGTLNAALMARRADAIAAKEAELELHLSTHLPADLWLVELRALTHETGHKHTLPFRDAQAGEVLGLPAGAHITLLTPYTPDHALSGAPDGGQPAQGSSRLWVATLSLPLPLQTYLERFGFPIRYGYVQAQWPISYYQTAFANEPGSAEMPSAGRAFTPELITQLVARGVQFAPLVLHTGVASLEDHEPPYEEFYRVPEDSARLINMARANHKRVIAVGTTAVRAIETVADTHGMVHPGEGWTRLVIGPARGIRIFDGLLTGFHEPRASHLAMLEALAGREHLKRAYAEALRGGYLWHEFGDLHLLLAG